MSQAKEDGAKGESLRLFEAAFVKLDQIEISPNIFASLASSLFQKMEKARLFCRGVGVGGNRHLVPLFDRIRGMFCCVFPDPVQNCAVVLQFISGLLKCT